YRPSLVDEWLAAMTRSSTSEAPAERAGGLAVGNARQRAGAPDPAELTVLIPTTVTQAEARRPRSSAARVAQAAKDAVRVVGMVAAMEQAGAAGAVPPKQPPETAPGDHQP